MSNKKINTVSSEMGSGYYYCPYIPVNIDGMDLITHRKYKNALEHLKGIIDVMKTLPRKNVEDICAKLSDVYDVDITLREPVILSDLNIFDFSVNAYANATPHKIFSEYYGYVGD